MVELEKLFLEKINTEHPGSFITVDSDGTIYLWSKEYDTSVYLDYIFIDSKSWTLITDPRNDDCSVMDPLNLTELFGKSFLSGILEPESKQTVELILK